MSTNVFAGQTFDFALGQGHANDRQLSVGVRNGGSQAVVQVVSALGPPFTVEATKMVETDSEAAALWNALRAEIGKANSLTFDTGITIASAVLMSVGQPIIHRYGGCDANLRCTFNLTFRAQAATPPESVLGEDGLGPGAGSGS